MGIDQISETIRRAMESAGLDPRSRLVTGVGATIRNALSAAGLRQADAADAVSTLDRPPHAVPAPGHAPVAPSKPGRFVEHTYTGQAGSRRYKLFIPSGPVEAPMPLVVMLHGCKQNPDDFATGTRMNALAQTQGFLVAYPAQSSNANGSNCWNWFNTRDQARDGGEAEIIAGIALEVAAAHAVDRSRIFAAGLSAGAAMAVIVGATHPEVFAAVGVHSGLPLGAASDIPSAFAAMSGKASMLSWTPSQVRGAGAVRAANPATPTIVFHGDRDTTVAASNGDAVVSQAGAAFAAAGVVLHADTAKGGSPGGRTHTVTRHLDPRGKARVERWELHGAGHAWSGGDAKGSYADAAGPNASLEMVRFFMAQ